MGRRLPKQPQSSVRPRASADSSAEKKTTEMSAIASAPTRLVEGQSNRRPHAISNGGRLNASRLMNAAGRIPNAAMLSANLQRVAHLLDARVDKYCSQPQTDGEYNVIASELERAIMARFPWIPAARPPTIPPIRL